MLHHLVERVEKTEEGNESDDPDFKLGKPVGTEAAALHTISFPAQRRFVHLGGTCPRLSSSPGRLGYYYV
jgi:hypothetical protein